MEEGETVEARYIGLDMLVGLVVGSVIRTEVVVSGSR